MLLVLCVSEVMISVGGGSSGLYSFGLDTLPRFVEAHYPHRGMCMQVGY